MEIGQARSGRIWSWAGSQEAAEARRGEASQIVGQRICQVRYFTIDYRRDELHPELHGAGPRAVSEDGELTEPTWLYDGFDAVDFGLEIVTDAGGTFSVTWDPPGEHEGIGIQPVPLLGSGVRRDADLAVWDVSVRSPSWIQLIGERVTAVDLHYATWDEHAGSLWCPRISIHSENRVGEILMGDTRNGVLTPSADTVAVLHPGTAMPSWDSIKG